MKLAAFHLVLWLAVLIGWFAVWLKFWEACQGHELAGGALAVGALWGITAGYFYRRVLAMCDWLSEEARKARDETIRKD